MLLWMNNTAHPTFTRVFMPGKFARSESAIAEVREVGLERYREILARLDSIAAAMPGPYWFGEQVSVLDAYALSLLRWGTLGGLDAAAFPAYKAYIERLALAPPVAAAIERERLQLFVAPR
jgi:glutathione S-transferase